jgi:integral membrane protein
VAVESTGRPGAGTLPGVLPAKTAKALQRYRIAAFVVGVGLLILCLAMVLRYAFDLRWATAVWGPIHGVLYAAYVLLAFDLGYRERWSFKGIIGVLLAGVVPILSFVVEKIVHRKVLARERI